MNNLLALIAIPYGIGMFVTWIHAQFWFMQMGFLLWLFFGSWLSMIAAALWPIYWLLI